MDSTLLKTLNNPNYEKRKNAALEIERLIRDHVVHQETARMAAIVAQLCDLATSTLSNNRLGGILGLAAASIALGIHIAGHLDEMVPPILACFNDPDSKVRYYACESMYNVAKVAKGEMLRFFNELFDALSILAADVEVTVKNAAELVDRLFRDIVVEEASSYVSALDRRRSMSRQTSEGREIISPGSDPIDDPSPSPSAPAGDKIASHFADAQFPQPPMAFSLERFVPLLSERIYVVNPHSRIYLISWLSVLDSVPGIELLSYLPSYLDGLLRYLADENSDIVTAAQNLLAEFLVEIREVAEVKAHRDSQRMLRQAQRKADSEVKRHRREQEGQGDDLQNDGGSKPVEETNEMDADDEGHGYGHWVPGQNVDVDHAGIVEILLSHLPYSDPEIQATCLTWLTEFLRHLHPVMIKFTPRLLPVILSCLALEQPQLRSLASQASQELMLIIQDLSPPPKDVRDGSNVTADMLIASPDAKTRTRVSSPPNAPSSLPFPTTEVRKEPGQDAPRSSEDEPGLIRADVDPGQQPDPFDYQATVSALTLQFLNECVETRVAALKWLSMLHVKAPHKILSMGDGTFPVLLKTLSDASEEVVRADLQLLAQISSNSEEGYFKSFMVNLLSLFSTDRRLLETRGSLIIRQLCVSLNTEKIYRTMAEILEKDEDIEFASNMVQNLNLIVITSPELSDFRKRLKNLESKDGQTLFVILYRSWSHNAVATFALCLLAQAYEPACSLLQIFAELEITVNLLIQIDKLVQLLESPVFTSLRLQLLEPDRYPYLYKALYGILMLLPQSSAFATLRNRLSAVSNLGFLHAAPRISYTAAGASPRPPGVRRQDEIKDAIRWQDLLSHFRAVQTRHERARLHIVQGSTTGSTELEPSFSGLGIQSHRAAGLPKRKPPPLKGLDADASRQVSRSAPTTGHRIHARIDIEIDLRSRCLPNTGGSKMVPRAMPSFVAAKLLCQHLLRRQAREIGQAGTAHERSRTRHSRRQQEAPVAKCVPERMVTSCSAGDLRRLPPNRSKTFDRVDPIYQD
ncbi:uncharacterized protein L969DRAFT_92262 [Mixia osmundae IAM 14324]|uniref:Vacuolar protein 14 C-terminal Fig4-binding domain-containing protein n=1 Tax=Mixia osmundae (strain CBS 9802 / IAM 14324 / JCM 22182 / KY 12970) TaxID=764103 RepID=G7DTH3_MIXOS|nr:uncharacterized protein L969DRAFT_92262 [Mixia osmundae IAM 14324]KEI42842.1 hypothetical protein L969DRAFT_92262 [Mixia osmundae IAM 14324]GAA93820.1 hypothetical protein E5Q_00466 [Mixia osmundae IAM 14324]